MTDPVLFVLTVLFLLGTPGPTNTLLATAGATVGLRRALPLMLGESTGYVVSIIAVGLLVGPALAAAPTVALALRLAVGAYLLWLALRLWRRGGVPVAGGRLVTTREVFVTTLLNPKAIIFALGVIPFAHPAWPAFMAAFVALVSVVAVGWIGLGILAGRAAGAAGRANLVPRIGAFVVAAFALVLVAGPFIRP